MNTRISTILLLLCCVFISSCQQQQPQEEPLANVIRRGLDVSTQQALLMAKALEHEEGQLPKSVTPDGKLETKDYTWWCCGFFPGQLWYLYENNASEEMKRYAELYTDRIEQVKYVTDNHDLGFMLYCSYGNGYRLTQKPAYKEVLLTGANSLSTRYKDNIGLIRSWDWNQDKWQYPVIIDNMMNLEFLMWASRASGDPRYHDMAISHADKTIENHFRPDNSSYHVVSYDTLTAKPHVKQTHQGATDESAWARGQAWGLYGYTMMYRESGKAEYLEQAKKIAHFIMNHPNMPEDKVPYWDFDAEDIPNTPRDASAAAIMASAFIELSQIVKGDLGKEYLTLAEQQIRSLSSPEYLAEVGENNFFTLKHSTGHFRGNSEVDVPLTYADYYYVEALLRMRDAMRTSVTSVLEIYDVETGQRSVVKEFPYTIEAPNWTMDGKWLIYNSKGRLYKLSPDEPGEPQLVDTKHVVRCNNDHVLAFDGKQVAVSSGALEDRSSRIYTMPLDGSATPRLITVRAPSYLHGWSPDGKELAYCADRNGNFDVYVIPAEGGEELRLTTAEGLDDGPEYSPDGKHIWFNSVRTGLMQVWRMNADGTEQTQMTFDEDRNSWFPHVSPDGKQVVYITYWKGDLEPGQHLANKNVELRMMSAEGGEPKTIVSLFGGQGTINVNSWAPDSKRFAFVSYRLNE